MKFTDLSPTGSPVHLPIALGLKSTDCYTIIKAFYLIDFNAEDYKETYSYQNPNGTVCIDLVPVNEGDEDIWRFANLVQVAKPAPAPTPFKSVNEFIQPIVPIITVDDESELAVFDGLEIDKPLDMFIISEVPMTIANLLNSHSTDITWVSSSYAPYSTAGVVILYNGTGEDCPSIYQVNKTAQRIVVLDIRQGNKKGIIFLQLE